MTISAPLTLMVRFLLVHPFVIYNYTKRHRNYVFSLTHWNSLPKINAGNILKFFLTRWLPVFDTNHNARRDLLHRRLGKLPQLPD